MNCPICNKEILEKRLEFLKKYNRKLTCIDCSSEEKMVANQVNVSKETRHIEIVSPEQAKRIHEVSKQNGVHYGRK